MKKLRASIAVIILAVICITGVIGPVTTYAADEYYVRKEAYGDYQDALYVKNETTGEDVVAYCYNAHKNWPGYRSQSVTKFENASQEKFLELASTPRDRNNLKKQVLEVCYKGFPRDGIGLKKKYNLDNDVFRMITQTAIWYYTDSMSLTSTQSWMTYSWMWTDDAKNAYNELISTAVSLPSNYTLDLYQNNSSNSQNILSTKLSKDYVPPTQYSIEFSKKDDKLDGAELGGATLQVLTKDGTLVEEWTSETGKTHTLALLSGEYIFREKKAPDGYEEVSDIYFTVDANGKVSINSKKNDQDTADSSDSKLTVVDKKKTIVYRTLSVKKVWELYGHEESEIPDSIQVQLYADDTAYGDPITLKKSENWSYEWKKLDSSKKYTVKEVKTPDDCVSRVEKGSDDSGVDFIIYNSMKPELTVKKIVRDGEWADKTRKFEFNIEFTDEEGNGINGSFPYVIEKEDGTEISTGKLDVKDGQAKFKIGHAQKIRIKGLPPNVCYYLQELLDEYETFVPEYYLKIAGREKGFAWAQITNEVPDNGVTVYNDFNYIVDTGIDMNNKYMLSGAFMILGGILLFGGIGIIRFRKRMK